MAGLVVGPRCKFRRGWLKLDWLSMVKMGTISVGMSGESAMLTLSYSYMCDGPIERWSPHDDY